ncbi:MAG: hypothetical protein IV090_03465 [Candidatus Sericytochromatia bacterium]|nr:hypothetical protein [Candidatus Sericytochromatia bacterium]
MFEYIEVFYNRQRLHQLKREPTTCGFSFKNSLNPCSRTGMC